MDKHTCKLCFRRFSNGRALGGHMRSHVTSAAAVAITTTKKPPPPPLLLLDYSSSSSSGPDEEGKEVGNGGGAQALYYGLRENPRKSFRLVDPEFSSTFVAVDSAFFAAATAPVAGGGSSSAVVHDRESETESSKAPPTFRRRSKRRRRSSPMLVKAEELHHNHHHPAETEPVSSVSDANPDEEVALCLMMLSRDVWPKQDEEGEQYQSEASSDDGDEEERSATASATASRSRRGGRSRFQCGTCKKVFKSYQALGGHRASHKKVVKPCTLSSSSSPPPAAAATHDVDDHHYHLIQDADPRTHQCLVCFRVFGSGQALGGHKRSHPNYPAAAAAAIATTPQSVTTASPSVKLGESFIDLNLPAPMEEELEVSAVYDGE